MKTFQQTIAALCCLALTAACASAVTFYVDSGTGNDADDGLSWGNAVATVGQALTYLAASNTAAAAGIGGHSIMVTNAGSLYDEQLTIATNHSGAVGSPNVLRGMGYPDIRDSGLGTAFTFNPATGKVRDFKIDGIRSGYVRGDPCLYLDAVERITLANSFFRGGTAFNGSHLIELRNPSDIVITNCVFYGSYESAIWDHYGTSTQVVKNCIFVGANTYAFEGAFNGVTEIYNCCFYANGAADITYNGTDYDTQSEVETDTIQTAGGYLLITNCLARNPGFARRAPLEFANAYYANSVADNGGENGGAMGPLYDRVTVSLPASPKTYYVSTTGTDGDGESWGTAFTTFRAATDRAVAGDTVIVGAGTYEEELVITNGGASISSVLQPVVYRAEGTVLITNVTFGIQLYGVGDVTVDGFEITGATRGVHVASAFSCVATNLNVYGVDDYGLSTSYAAKNTFVDCRFHDLGSGINNGGVYMASRTVNWSRLKRCEIFNVYQGHGIQVTDTGVRVDSCTIYNNDWCGIGHGLAGYGLPVGALGNVNVYNCLIYSNGYGGGTYSEGDGTGSGSNMSVDRHHGIGEGWYEDIYVYNSTLYGNARDGLSSGIGEGAAYNCIFAGNGQYGIHGGPPYGGVNSDNLFVIAKNCLFWDNGTAVFGSGTNHYCDVNGVYNDGNLTSNVVGTADDIDRLVNSESGNNTNSVVADPQFIDVASDNFRVKPGSPALDAALASYVPSATLYFPNQSVDVYGDPRAKSTEIDIGAAEWQPWAGTIMLIR